MPRKRRTQYDDSAAAAKFAKSELGVKEKSEGLHDDSVITSTIMTVNPAQVRLKQREAKDRIVGFRADQTVAAIRKAIGTR